MNPNSGDSEIDFEPKTSRIRRRLIHRKRTRIRSSHHRRPHLRRKRLEFSPGISHLWPCFLGLVLVISFVCWCERRFIEKWFGEESMSWSLFRSTR